MKKILKYNLLQRYLESFKNFKWYNYVTYVFIMLIIIIAFGLFPPILLILGTLMLIHIFIRYLSNNRLKRILVGSGIVSGSRGSGKGLIFQYKAKIDKIYFSNVNFGYNYKHFKPVEYFDSIKPNTLINTINDNVVVVDKLHKFEGVNILFDDTNLYAPNFMDSELKKLYPTMPLMLSIARHLYNHDFIINTQDFSRPYKILRELQQDFFIKALSTKGFSKFRSGIPYFRNFVVVKYRYYDKWDSALAGVLPFNAGGLLSKAGKGLILGTGQAIKEQFTSTYGEIFESKLYLNKKDIHYDTRYFHELFFGVKSPK